ncbi:MAG TPA: hypothetical protein VFQ53_28720 [Kofleriaceae bacterium]|nr:hypothetical protein [Kofleriaceae bacterium]
MRHLILLAIVVTAVGAAPRSAAAYPQYQLSRDQTCTGCHIAPAGGGLLNENGLATAESTSQFGTAPEFFYGKVPSPGWLTLGGDLRGAGGYIQTPQPAGAAFPMQADLYAHAAFGPISVQVTFGPRSPTEGNEAATYVWSREHYLMYRQNPDENTGLYIRAGRFMPVVGLRFAEHPMYTRRYGGTQLYTETYGAAIEYIDQKAEVHVTGFIPDPVIDNVENAAGAAAYGELRLSETFSIGALGMFKNTDDDQKIHAGITSKLYLSGPDLLFQLEVQFVNQLVKETPTNPDGGAPKGIVGNLVASKMLTDWLLLDVGIGHYDSNLRIKNLDRDCVDLNLHWFATSHLEIALNARYELIGFGDSDPGAYALLQGHYRL